MKVQIVGRENYTAYALADRLTFEEDEPFLSEEHPIKVRSTDFEGISLASVTIEALYGYEVQVMDPEPYCLLGFFGKKGFSSQMGIGIPLTGFPSQRQGISVAMGSGVKIMDGRNYPAMFSLFNDKLASILEGIGHHGVVTLEISHGRVQQIYLGAPSFMHYAIMECWPGRLSEFLVDPTSKPFFERWTVSSHVTCFPYPAALETKEKALVRGLIRPVRKHFWAFTANGIMKESFKTQLTILGVVTAWDHSLASATRRVLGTCSNIMVPMMQFRTDLLPSISDRWKDVEPILC